MVGWFVVWLVGWLVGSLFGCLVSWLGGWLVGWLVGCSLTLYIAAVSTAWPLLGSPQNGQATCYLFFFKHLLYRERVPNLSMETFLKRTENAWCWVGSASSLSILPL